MATVGEVLATYHPSHAVNEGETYTVDPATQEATPVDLTAINSPVIQALLTVGFGAAGQVLATNSEGDGFEWIDLET